MVAHTDPVPAWLRRDTTLIVLLSRLHPHGKQEKHGRTFSNITWYLLLSSILMHTDVDIFSSMPTEEKLTLLIGSVEYSTRVPSTLFQGASQVAEKASAPSLATSIGLDTTSYVLHARFGLAMLQVLSRIRRRKNSKRTVPYLMRPLPLASSVACTSAARVLKQT